jgi:hypothetical protein
VKILLKLCRLYKRDLSFMERTLTTYVIRAWTTCTSRLIMPIGSTGPIVTKASLLLLVLTKNSPCLYCP